MSRVKCLYCDVYIHTGAMGCGLCRKCQNLKDVTCVQCGGCFKSSNASALYCNRECRRLFNLNKNRVQSSRYEKKGFGGIADCEWCSVEYDKKNPVQKYCSSVCCVAANKARQAASLFVVFERDRFSCIYCGKSSIEDGIVLVVDHIWPFSKGGKETMGNLVTACASCNLVKKDAVLEQEILKRIAVIVQSRNEKAGMSNERIVKGVAGNRRSKQV